MSTASSGEAALDQLKINRFPIVVTDISMPKMDGIELLNKIKLFYPETAVVIMTAHGSTESAVEAMKLGASDYLTKPFQIDEMKLVIQSALKAAALEKENRLLRSELGKSYSFDKIIGNSPAMMQVFDMIKRVSATKTNIMILGESGTGKELVAHSIHHNSAEANSPFVAVNCGAVPESLFESELFGHKKGSFTGATNEKIGIFEQAHKGTLFLDEVGDIPPLIQVKLLRAIQGKSFRPVGGAEEIQVDVRIICATHRNLEEMVKTGAFREDLFYRLNVIQIKMPALRERKEDIPLLAESFLARFNLSMGKLIKSISKEAMRTLTLYDFPGNVRELENIIERAVALEVNPSILPESLPHKLSMKDGNAPNPAIPSALASPIPENIPPGFDLEKSVENLERAYINKALEQAHGVKKKAAGILGVSFRSLRYRIEKYGIHDPNPTEAEQ